MKIKLLVFLLAGASLVLAQTGDGGRLAQFTELKTYLNLTDSQVASLQQIQQTARTDQRTLAQTMRRKSQELRQQVKSGSANATAVGQLTLDIQASRKQLQDIQSRLNTQALAVLTPDQKTKLGQLEAAAKLRREIGEASRLGLLDPSIAGGDGLGMLNRLGPELQNLRNLNRPQRQGRRI